MRKVRNIFDRKTLLFCIVSLFFALIIFFFLPEFTRQFSFSNHIAFRYYLRQLHTIILILPISLFLFSIIPVRKLLDYSKYIGKIKTLPFLLSIFLISFFAANLISYFFYNHIPQGDAVVTFFQAKIFSSGHLWANLPKHPEFFLESMVSSNGKWFGMVQHGHSLLLTPFMVCHISYILSPLLASLSLIIFFCFLQNAYNEKTAKLGTIFLLLSPTFLFISSSYLNQNSSFFLILLSLFFLSKAKTKDTSFFPFIAGVFSGFAFLSRTSVLTFIPPIIIFLILCKRKKGVLFFLLGFLPTFSIQFIDNLLYTGNLFRFGYALHSNANLHSIGFGMGKGEPSFGILGHTPLKALLNLLYNIFASSLHLFGWPLLSLTFIPLAFYKWKRNVWDIFAISVILTSILFFSFYWFHGVSPMGPKYYFEIVPLFVLLTVRGIKKFNVKSLITILFIFDIFVYIPSGLKIFNTVWGTNNNCYNEVKKQELHNAVVFIKDLPGKNEQEITINRHNYLSVAFRNNPDIKKGDIIYAKDLGTRDTLLLDEFKERKVYVFEYLGGGKSWKLQPYSPL